MKRKKESHSGTGIPKREMETIGQSNTTVSGSDSTIPEQKFKAFISSFLSVGEADAIGMEALTKLCGLSDTRSLRKAIQSEREQTIILASPKGYFLPERDAEGKMTECGYRDTKRFYRKTKRMGLSLLRSARTARLAMIEFERANTDGQNSDYDLFG